MERVHYSWVILPITFLTITVAGYGGGLSYNVFFSYTWAFLYAGMFCLLASLFVIVIKKDLAISKVERVSI